MRRQYVIFVVAACLHGVRTEPAAGQVRQWTNPGSGSWFVAGNWNTGVPAAGETAFVDNGGTAQIISGSTPALSSVAAGGNSAAFTGFIEITNGALTATSAVYVGNIGTGHLEQNGASSLTAQTLCLGCNGTSGDGTLVLNGGTITASSAFYVANIGTGHLEQNAGSTITAQTFCVGCNGSQSDGTFVQNGGIVNPTSVMYVGHVGTGLVTQNGGTINAPQVILAGQPSGDATWDMNGGDLNVTGQLSVGDNGFGQFTQHAPATVSASGGVMIARLAGSTGSYALEGGALTAGDVRRGPAATGSFGMNGGRLEVGEFGSTTTAFPLTVDGGTVALGGNVAGTTTVRGDYVQNGAGRLEIQLNGPSAGSYDVLRVFGGVTLNNGMLNLLLGFTPAGGETFLIVDNDGTDAVFGTFAGLPEGATVTVTIGGNPYDFQISYVGGTGNDVVLTAQQQTCVQPPPDMVAWWPLDELAGTTSEELVNNLNGVHVGGPTPLAGGYVDNSLCFNGISQYVEVPDAPELDFGTGDLTIDAWVRTTSVSGVRVIVEKRSNPVSPPGVVGYSMYLFNGQLSFQLADGDGNNFCECTASAACTNYGAGAPGFVADGQWRHVAVTVVRAVAGGGTFYVDGAPVGVFDPICRPASISNDSPLRIGRMTAFTGSNFDGCIDEVELFDRALSASEIAGIHAAGAAGKCKCTCPADVNGDDVIDGNDVAAFARCLPQARFRATAVPAPTWTPAVT